MPQRFRRERGRKFDRFSFRDNPQAATYRHLFYLGDGAGCLHTALHPWHADVVAEAKSLARERLQQARATFPKPACRLP